MKMNLICMVRHGETDANRDMIVQGRIDNPLNALGRDQAQTLATRFREAGDVFDVVVASPLVRAAETARIVAAALGRLEPVELDPGFLERDFGTFDGCRIDAGYAPAVIANAIPGMETHERLEARVFAALQALVDRHPGRRILLVTHSHVIKAVLVRLLPPSTFTYASYLPNASVNRIRWDGTRFDIVNG